MLWERASKFKRINLGWNPTFRSVESEWKGWSRRLPDRAQDNQDNKVTLTPQQFAEMFVDNNFAG